jgi:hypothetical protein
LNTSISYGSDTGMDETRKITVEVPEAMLALAQDYTGAGVTETVREGLKRLAGARAQLELRKLRGSFKFSVDLNALREDRPVRKSRK